MLLKLDLKRFLILEWSFIRTNLQYFNSPPSIIKLNMFCVTTSSIYVLINGTCTSFFIPSRGICQGDPLSPYLFILCTVMLSRRINMAVDYTGWAPIKISRRGPHLSNLFFADVTIITSKGTVKCCHTIIDTLNAFNNASGQKIIFSK